MDQKKETEDENSEDSEISEQDSPKKRPHHQGRAARVGRLTNPYEVPRQQLNNMKQEERQKFDEGVTTALRAKAAREDDTAVEKVKAQSKLNRTSHKY